jgi:hypothetical protein
MNAAPIEPRNLRAEMYAAGETPPPEPCFAGADSKGAVGWIISTVERSAAFPFMC